MVLHHPDYVFVWLDASGEEDLKGRLEAGMLADFVELSDDPFEVDPAAVVDLEVRSTWVGSRCVFRAPGEG